MTDERIKISLIQSSLVWENPHQNIINFDAKINQIKNSDLIVLPEMFTTGFTMHPEQVAETMQGNSVGWMINTAKQKNSAIFGSLIIKENDNFYNRAIFVYPNGKIETYDKKHLFTLAGEHKKYTNGNARKTISYKGFKICLNVCYDLRFPVWSRNTDDYDVLIYVANWPKKRVEAWSTLLKARAIENMSYCVGVNRVGLDANNLEYSGNSAVFDCLGKEVSTIKPNKEQTETITITKKHILETRQKLGFLNDKDEFKFN